MLWLKGNLLEAMKHEILRISNTEFHFYNTVTKQLFVLRHVMFETMVTFSPDLTVLHRNINEVFQLTLF